MATSAMSLIQSGDLPANLSNVPGMVPPAGVIPNFENPHSRGEIYTAVATTIMVAMYICVTCKLYTKYFIVRKLGWDDLTCLLGALAATAYYINCLYEVKHGNIGIHQWNVRLSYLTSDAFLIPSYLGVILVPPAMIFTKSTFFLMYLQIFWPFKWLRNCIYIGATLTTIFYVATEIFWIYYMTPKKGKTFASMAASPAEYEVLVLSVPIAAVGLGIDVYLLVLPITAVVQLQLPTRRKIGVILIFLTGTAACVSSALSVYYRTLLNKSSDFTWNLVSVNVLSIAEMSIGLCCVSMPALSKMLGHHLPPYGKFKSWFNPWCISAKTRTSWNSSRLGRKLLFDRSENPSRSRDSYVDIEANKSRRHAPDALSSLYEQGPMKESVQTFIRSGKNKVIDNDDGIHYEIEMQQHSQHYDSR